MSGPESDIRSLVEALKKQAALVEGDGKKIPDGIDGDAGKESDLSSIRQESLSGWKERPDQGIDDDALIGPKPMKISNGEGNEIASQVESGDHRKSGEEESKASFAVESPPFNTKILEWEEGIENIGDSWDDSSDHLQGSNGHRKHISTGGNSKPSLRMDTKWSETTNEPGGSLSVAPLIEFSKDKDSNLGEEIDLVLRRKSFGNKTPGQPVDGLAQPNDYVLQSSDGNFSTNGSTLELLSNMHHNSKQKESEKVQNFVQKEWNLSSLKDSIINPGLLKSENQLRQQTTIQRNLTGMPASMDELQQVAGNPRLMVPFTGNPELGSLASQVLEDPKLMASVVEKGLGDPKLMASLVEKGTSDPNLIASLTGKDLSDPNLIASLTGKGFIDPNQIASLEGKGLSNPKLMASMASQGSGDHSKEQETPKSFWDLVSLKLTWDHWKKMNPGDYFFNVFNR